MTDPHEPLEVYVCAGSFLSSPKNFSILFLLARISQNFSFFYSCLREFPNPWLVVLPAIILPSFDMLLSVQTLVALALVVSSGASSPTSIPNGGSSLPKTRPSSSLGEDSDSDLTTDSSGPLSPLTSAQIDEDPSVTGEVTDRGDSEAPTTSTMGMYVKKRNGEAEPIFFDKITARLQSLTKGLNTKYVDVFKIAQKVVSGIYPGVHTAELDNLAAETAAYMSTLHPDYARLAARISISNLHKETSPSFSTTLTALFEAIDPKTGSNANFIAPTMYKLVRKFSSLIDAKIDHDRDYNMNYFGFKTLERSYLLRDTSSGNTLERPQYMWMRVALGIHCSDIDIKSTPKETINKALEAAFETYDLMSTGHFTHASPTLFHAGTTHPQLSSCFLLQMTDDSITGIYDTLKKCAVISKGAGGIGLSVHNIRARGSYIKGTKGVSNGLVPMLRVFDVTSRYVDQGGGKRPGAFAVYIEPWHADIFDVLDLKKNTGKEEQRARDLFYGLWICDLFMKRVEEDGDWSLMCPNQCPGLSDCFGEEFEKLYKKYEKEGKVVKTIKARQLWNAILDAQVETGTPYMLYKDACNKKSNQKNLGTIKSSNLCTEIVEYTDPDEVAVCNLASVCLPKFVKSDRDEEHGSPMREGDAKFDFEALHNVVKIMTRNLNKIIDINLYPLDDAKRSNSRHRPVGLGVSGLADAFIRMGLPFDSPGAKELNSKIFETIYHAAVEASCELAEINGPYETFKGSPASEGKLQMDLWESVEHELMYDWASLRERVKAKGLRNSLLVAPMPTASTSQILGVNECIEPYTSNMYVRRVKSGEFIVTNPHLMKDLSDRGMWTEKVRNHLMKEGGSVSTLPGVPDRLKDIYKTVWEVKMRDLIDMAADRGRFIDQSQSLNLFQSVPSPEKLTAMHFYAWKKGLKTGMYYLRTKPAAKAIQFTVDPSGSTGSTEGGGDEDDICLSCQG